MIPLFSMPFLVQFFIWCGLGALCMWFISLLGVKVFRLWDARDAYDPGRVIRFIRGTLFMAAFFVGPYLILNFLVGRGIVV